MWYLSPSHSQVLLSPLNVCFTFLLSVFCQAVGRESGCLLFVQNTHTNSRTVLSRTLAGGKEKAVKRGRRESGTRVGAKAKNSLHSQFREGEKRRQHESFTFWARMRIARLLSSASRSFLSFVGDGVRTIPTVFSSSSSERMTRWRGGRGECMQHADTSSRERDTHESQTRERLGVSRSFPSLAPLSKGEIGIPPRWGKRERRGFSKRDKCRKTGIHDTTSGKVGSTFFPSPFPSLFSQRQSTGCRPPPLKSSSIQTIDRERETTCLHVYHPLPAVVLSVLKESQSWTEAEFLLVSAFGHVSYTRPTGNCLTTVKTFDSTSFSLFDRKNLPLILWLHHHILCLWRVSVSEKYLSSLIMYNHHTHQSHHHFHPSSSSLPESNGTTSSSHGFPHHHHHINHHHLTSHQLQTSSSTSSASSSSSNGTASSSASSTTGVTTHQIGRKKRRGVSKQ